MNDYNLYSQVKHLIGKLEPIRSSLNMMQTDTATIADAAEVWMDLVGNEELQDHAQEVRKRCAQALGPVHAAANMLDPRYRGRKLNTDLRHAAEEWAGEELLADLVLLQTEQPPYPDTFFKHEFIKKLTPKSWWLGLKQRPGVSKMLCDKALAIMDMPPSSASVERTFSSFALLQTKLRNRLGMATAEKLVFCYRSLRGSKETNW